MLQSTGSELIDKLQGITYYLYFPALVAHGLHILYTIPLGRTSPAAPSYTLTDVTFQVYSSVEVTRNNWIQISASAKPVLAILGMTDGRPLPNHYLSYSTNWVARVDRSLCHGTVAISNTDQNVLHRLARINSLTSVIPVLTAADETDGSQLQLTIIAARHGDRACPWKAEKIQENSCIKYEWEYIVSTAHSHAGSGITNGAYSATCKPRAFLSVSSLGLTFTVKVLPRTMSSCLTVFRSGKLEISVWGEVTVDITYKAGSVEGA